MKLHLSCLLSCLVLAACSSGLVGGKACEKHCHDSIPTYLLVFSGGGGEAVVTESELEALCDEAPRTNDCEECFEYIHTNIFDPYHAYLDCGCGLTTDGVSECIGDNHATDEELSAILEDCYGYCDESNLKY